MGSSDVDDSRDSSIFLKAALCVSCAKLACETPNAADEGDMPLIASRYDWPSTAMSARGEGAGSAGHLHQR